MAYVMWVQNKNNANLTLLLDSEDLCYSPCNPLIGVILDNAAIVALCIKILCRKVIFSALNIDSIS